MKLAPTLVPFAGMALLLCGCDGSLSGQPDVPCGNGACDGGPTADAHDAQPPQRDGPPVLPDAGPAAADAAPDQGADLGPCADLVCGAGEHCAVGPSGAFCTTCDPQACGAVGAICCPDHAGDGQCTQHQLDAENCGTCGTSCAADELCNAGSCQPVGTLAKCSFDPMQWWRSPTAHDQRDITFAVLGDTHAEDANSGCSHNSNGAPDQNHIARQALNSILPGPGWTSHLWPAGAAFYREGKPYDHLRGVIIAGDLTQAGAQSAPAGQQTCREYRSYRDAYGRCGSEGRLVVPVYDGYGNHDFPRVAGSGDVTFHPVIDRLDAITAAHRPGAAADLFDDPDGGSAHFAWRWDDIWFVNLNVKPGWKLEPLANSSGARIVDPHHSRGFLQALLLAQPASSTRQIVVLSHYPINGDRVDPAEQESFCKLIYNAQHASGAFSQQKLSLSHPVVAFLHGHDHKVPSQVDWTCPSPYQSVTLPLFRVGTPLYKASQNQGGVQFSIFRLGTTKLEVVGVRAPASDPTGPWTIIYAERLPLMNAP